MLYYFTDIMFYLLAEAGSLSIKCFICLFYTWAVDIYGMNCQLRYGIHVHNKRHKSGRTKKADHGTLPTML